MITLIGVQVRDLAESEEYLEAFRDGEDRKEELGTLETSSLDDCREFCKDAICSSVLGASGLLMIAMVRENGELLRRVSAFLDITDMRCRSDEVAAEAVIQAFFGRSVEEVMALEYERLEGKGILDTEENLGLREARCSMRSTC